MSRNILFETLGGYVTAPSSTLTELTLTSGQSKKIRTTARAAILPPYLLTQGAGSYRLRAGTLHEGTFGITINHATGAEFNLNPLLLNPIGSGDDLTMELSGSATASDQECMATTVMYTDPVSKGCPELLTPMELNVRRTGHSTTAYATITAGTSGGFGGATALTSFTHKLPGGKKYAIVGMTSTVAQGCIAINGPCTGDVYFGVPGVATNRQMFSRYFIDLANAINQPCIPVLSTDDLAITSVYVLNNENAASPIVNILLEELAS